MEPDFLEWGGETWVTQEGARMVFLEFHGIDLPEYHDRCYADTVPTFRDVIDLIFGDPPLDKPEDAIERFTIWVEGSPDKPRQEFDLPETIRCPLAEYFFKKDLAQNLPDLKLLKVELGKAETKLKNFETAIARAHAQEGQPFGVDRLFAESDANARIAACRSYLSSYRRAIRSSEDRIAFMRPRSTRGRAKEPHRKELVERLLTETDFPGEAIALVLIRYGIARRNKPLLREPQNHWCVQKVMDNMKRASRR